MIIEKKKAVWVTLAALLCLHCRVWASPPARDMSPSPGITYPTQQGALVATDSSRAATINNVRNAAPRSVTEFGVVCDTTWNGTAIVPGTDNYLTLNAAFAAAASGGFPLSFPQGEICGVATGTLTMPQNVVIQGWSSSPFYCGLPYFAGAQSDPVLGPRIIALPGFPTATPTPLITLTYGTGSNQGWGIFGMVLDANKLASNAIYASASIQKERVLTLKDSCIQGAASDGIYASDMIGWRLTGNSISANDGFGVKAAFGFTDFQFTDNFIHTNKSGGLYFGDGTVYGQVTGGKIENNYGPGLFAGTVHGASNFSVSHVMFQQNNGPGVVASGAFNALVILHADAFANNGLSVGSPATVRADIVAESSGTLLGDNLDFFSTDGELYYATADTGHFTNPAVVLDNPHFFSAAPTANYYGNVVSNTQLNYTGSTPTSVSWTQGLTAPTVNATTGYQSAGVPGFSGTKTAGSCIFVFSGGILTSVSGC